MKWQNYPDLLTLAQFEPTLPYIFFYFTSHMNITRRFLFVINPISGTRAKDGLERFLMQKCKEQGIEYTILHSTKTTNALTLEMAAYDFKATDLVACGGDGTVNISAAAAMSAGINLGIIPVGSGNGLARTAGIAMKPSLAFNTLLEGSLMPTDGFYINGKFGCMLSGVGMDAAVAERFAQSHRRGIYTYTTETLIQFFKANPYQFEINIDGFRFFTDAFFISVANSNQYGNNVTIAPLASLNDAMLDVIIVQKMPKAALPFAIMRQMRQNQSLKNWTDQIGKRSILYFQTPSISISNLKLAPLHIDGDPSNTEEQLQYEIIPQAFKLWVPTESKTQSAPQKAEAHSN